MSEVGSWGRRYATDYIFWLGFWLCPCPMNQHCQDIGLARLGQLFTKVLTLVSLVLIRKLWRLDDSEKIEAEPEPEGSGLLWNSGGFTWWDVACEQKEKCVAQIGTGIVLSPTYAAWHLGLEVPWFQGARLCGDGLRTCLCEYLRVLGNCWKSRFV